MPIADANVDANVDAVRKRRKKAAEAKVADEAKVAAEAKVAPRSIGATPKVKARQTQNVHVETPPKVAPRSIGALKVKARQTQNVHVETPPKEIKPGVSHEKSRSQFRIAAKAGSVGANKILKYGPGGKYATMEEAKVAAAILLQQHKAELAAAA